MLSQALEFLVGAITLVRFALACAGAGSACAVHVGLAKSVAGALRTMEMGLPRSAAIAVGALRAEAEIRRPTPIQQLPSLGILWSSQGILQNGTKTGFPSPRGGIAPRLVSTWDPIQASKAITTS